MISPLTGNLNHNNTQALNFKLESLSATPSAGQAGRLIFQTSQNQPEVDDGSALRRIPAIQTSTIVHGDLVVASSALQFIRLPNSTTSQIGTPLVSATSGPHYESALRENWVTFNASTSDPAVFDSFGVTTSAGTITALSSTIYVIPWAVPFANASYSVMGLGTGLTFPAFGAPASSAPIQSTQATMTIRRGDGVGVASTYFTVFAVGRV